MKHFLRMLLFLVVLVTGLALSIGARAEGDEIDKVAEALVSQEPSSEAWKKASEALKKMSGENQGKVGQAMVQKTTADAEKQVKWLTTLNSLGASAGKDPIGKSLGKVVSKMFGGLAKLVRDPTLGGGEEKLAEELIKGGLDADEAYEVAGQVRTAVQAKRNEAESRKKAPQANGGGKSVSFSGAADRLLTFSGDVVTSVTIPPAAPTSADAIVGAALVLPTFVLSSEEGGEFVFTAVGDETMRIGDDVHPFVTGTVPLVTFRNNRFFIIVMDLALADAGADSFFHDDLLAPQGSDYGVAADAAMMGLPYGKAFAISFAPTTDFFAATGGWTQARESDVLMEAGPVGYAIPEPPLPALVVGALGLVAVRRRLF